MAGYIGVACAETGRYSAFSEALARLEKPEGTQVAFAKGSDRELARNVLVRDMLSNPDYEWMLFVDDDQVFAEDLLARLLLHEKLDIVGGIYLRRDVPFSPIAYEAVTEQGQFVPLDMKQHAHDAVVEVKAAGTGAMLVRRRVFETMADPWFIRSDKGTEDMLFCLKARLEHKFSVYVDLGVRVGHMTIATVWPSTGEDGEWAAGFQISDFDFMAKM